MTASEAALSYGLAQQCSEQGPTPFSFGGVTFRAITAAPIEIDRGIPRGTSFGPEHDFEVMTLACVFKGGFPVPGNTITRNGISYRVVSVQLVPDSHNIVIRCVQPKPASR